MLDSSQFATVEDIPYTEAGHDLSNYKMAGLDDIDPEAGYCGKFYDPQDKEHQIRYDDEEVYALINSQKTDTVFQFDTALAKQILSNAAEGQGVHNPHILTLLNACGHPGPMAMIPKALENRDDPTESWKQDLRNIHPIMEEILSPTLGIIVYQEQLTALWQRLGGFSATEAQDARKDVAKKRLNKIAKIRGRWITGATKTLGEEFATKYFDEVMEPFGRYAFNKCLSSNTQLTCIKTGKTATVQQWVSSDNKPWLWSYNGKEVVPDKCVDIHESGYLEMFNITFEDGRTECVTEDHQFLCQDGQYHTVRDIIANNLDVVAVSPPLPRLGYLQKLVLGLCTVHTNMTVSKIAHELARPRRQIDKVIKSLQDKDLLHDMQPVSRMRDNA